MINCKSVVFRLNSLTPALIIIVGILFINTSFANKASEPYQTKRFYRMFTAQDTLGLNRYMNETLIRDKVPFYLLLQSFIQNLGSGDGNEETKLLTRYAILESGKVYSKYNSRLINIIDRLKFSNKAMSDNIQATAYSNPTKSKEKNSINSFNMALVLFIVAASFFGLGFLLARKKLPVKRSVKTSKNNNSEASQQLTERELEVLSLIADYKSNPEIANLLFISINTTKTHVANIMNKLNAKNRQHAIDRANELNILNKPIPTKNVITTSVFILMTLSFTAYGQHKIVNESSCDFLIKVNVLDTGNCRFDGLGPLVKVEAGKTVDLPELPSSSWIVGFGIQEVGLANNPLIIGDTRCLPKQQESSFGSCRARISYVDQNLIIKKEK